MNAAELAEALAAGVGPILDATVQLEPLSGGTTFLVDSTSKFLVRSPSGEPWAVVLCSAPAEPQMVARAMLRAREIKSELGAVLGRPVMAPIGEGCLEGRSFAVLPYALPLHSSGVLRRLQNLALRRRLFGWLGEAARATARPVSEADWKGSLVGPLQQLAGDEEFPGAMRDTAAAALAAAGDGSWQPRHVFMHDDFWSGNVLIEPGSPGGRFFGDFVVIDWGGATLEGYPFYDFLRLCCETGFRGRAFFRALDRQCAALECDRRAAGFHLLTAAAECGPRIENWPRKSYIATMEACYWRLVTGN